MILVTGSTGLFGRILTQRLRAERRPFAGVGRCGPVTIEADLRVSTQAAHVVNSTQPDVIVHLAGGRGADRFDLYERNVLTTVQVIGAATGLGTAPLVIVMGSAAEYGEGMGVPISEDTLLRPVSEYGHAKVAQTTIALAMGKRLGIPILLLRPFNPVSPELDESTALGNARAQLLAGKGPTRKLKLGRLDVIRDFVPVDTIIEAIVRGIDRRPESGILNICSGKGITLEEVVLAMATKLGVGLSIEIDSDLARLPAPDVVVGDPTRLRSQLGIEALVTPDSLAKELLS